MLNLDTNLLNCQVEWNVRPEVLAKMRIIQKNMSPWELEVEPSDEPDVPNMYIMNSDIPKLNSFVYYFSQGHRSKMCEQYYYI